MRDAVSTNIFEWVEQARQDPVRYFERQATEVVLNAIGMAPALGSKIFLKGGILMGVVYQSPRQTADLDFSTSLEPGPEVDIMIRDALDEMLPRAAAHLGYPDLTLRVQTVTRRPRKNLFSEADFPAIGIKVGYARRGSAQERALASGKCVNVIELDVSFNEPVTNAQILNLGSDGTSIRAYSLIDLIAEKLRALLQQPGRNRFRRQDVYDIALLLKKFDLDENERARILDVFRSKCRFRRIEPGSESLSDPEVVRRAKAEWETLALEIGELPSFDESFALVRTFYRSLPWTAISAIERETNER